MCDSNQSLSKKRVKDDEVDSDDEDVWESESDDETISRIRRAHYAAAAAMSQRRRAAPRHKTMSQKRKLEAVRDFHDFTKKLKKDTGITIRGLVGNNILALSDFSSDDSESDSDGLSEKEFIVNPSAVEELNEEDESYIDPETGDIVEPKQKSVKNSILPTPCLKAEPPDEPKTLSISDIIGNEGDLDLTNKTVEIAEIAEGELCSDKTAEELLGMKQEDSTEFDELNKHIEEAQKEENISKEEMVKEENKMEIDEEKKPNPNALNVRRNIRDVMDEKNLDASTLAAQRQESERLARVQEQQRIIREVQRQIALNRQNKLHQKTLSLLQGGSSILKSKTGQKLNLPNTVLVKLPSGEVKKTIMKQGQLEVSKILKPTTSGVATKIGKPEKKEVVEIVSSSSGEESTSSSSDSDDCIMLSDSEVPPSPEAEDDPSNSGLHVNDAYNISDEQGRVQINIGHPENEEDIFLAPQIARVIKPHQIGGVRFLFDNIIESVERFSTSTGFGCILAHSMGLGKTLQIVCFCDIFLRHTKSKTVLCIMPINTLQNWVAEFNMWLPTDSTNTPLAAHGEVRHRNFPIYVLNDSHKTLHMRAKVVKDWTTTGGVLMIGYELFRLLSMKKDKKPRKKKKADIDKEKEKDDKKPEDDAQVTDNIQPKPPDESRLDKDDGELSKDAETKEDKKDDVGNDEEKKLLDEMYEALVKPGPDLVICDEGHRIKNSHSNISYALKQMRTKRRVVLTGYPLQNNLLEYWCMVDFVRPNYLGSKTEFCNMFERPIQNGQCIDSTPQDIRLMRYRAHVLHSLLVGFVQRRSHAVLQSTLPQKEEYVLLVRMTPLQRKLYDRFMNEVVRLASVPNPLKAFAICCKIWNHPDVLYNFLRKRSEVNAAIEEDLDLEEIRGVTKAGRAKNPRAPPKRAAKPRAAAKKPAATIPPNTTTASNPPRQDGNFGNQYPTNGPYPPASQPYRADQPGYYSNYPNPNQQGYFPPNPSYNQNYGNNYYQHPPYPPNDPAYPNQYPNSQDQNYNQNYWNNSNYYGNPGYYNNTQYPNQPPQDISGNPPSGPNPQYPSNYNINNDPSFTGNAVQPYQPPNQEGFDNQQRQFSTTSEFPSFPVNAGTYPNNQNSTENDSTSQSFSVSNSQESYPRPNTQFPNPTTQNFPSNAIQQNYSNSQNPPIQTPPQAFPNQPVATPQEFVGPPNNVETQDFQNQGNNTLPQGYVNQPNPGYPNQTNNPHVYQNQQIPTPHVYPNQAVNTIPQEATQTYPSQPNSAPPQGFQPNTVAQGYPNQPYAYQNNTPYDPNQAMPYNQYSQNPNFPGYSNNCQPPAPSDVLAVKSESEIGPNFGIQDVKPIASTAAVEAGYANQSYNYNQDQVTNGNFSSQYPSYLPPLKIKQPLDSAGSGSPVTSWPITEIKTEVDRFKAEEKTEVKSESDGEVKIEDLDTKKLVKDETKKETKTEKTEIIPLKKLTTEKAGKKSKEKKNEIHSDSENEVPKKGKGRGKSQSKKADPKLKKGKAKPKGRKDRKSSKEKDNKNDDSESDESEKEEKLSREEELALTKKAEDMTYDWAAELLKDYIPGIIENSAKMDLFFYILNESIRLGDRILLFSQSLFTLNLIEDFLEKNFIPGTTNLWQRNTNYYRLDGSTHALEREKLINEFNTNPHIYLFLVSTRAGSLGINLVGANRVIVFDASWNPCHDTQAVCRVYRYGQKKPCFVYRFVMDWCLEKKIYDRQINKQGMADRVVDECNPDAVLSMKEITNLCIDNDEKEAEIKDLSEFKDKYLDVVMQGIISDHGKLLSKEPFQHESLLVDRKEKKLSSAEKRLAKRGYELEKKAALQPKPTMAYRTVRTADGSIVQRPVASVRPMQHGARWIPADVWRRQGMTAQEMTLPLDVVIPTNSAEKTNIVLKAGQRVMVLKSPKGIYMQLESGKIIAIKTSFKGMGQKLGDNKDSPVGKKIMSNRPALPGSLKNNTAITITSKTGIRPGLQRVIRPGLGNRIIRPITQGQRIAELKNRLNEMKPYPGMRPKLVNMQGRLVRQALPGSVSITKVPKDSKKSNECSPNDSTNADTDNEAQVLDSDDDQSNKNNKNEPEATENNPTQTNCTKDANTNETKTEPSLNNDNETAQEPNAPLLLTTDEKLPTEDVLEKEDKIDESINKSFLEANDIAQYANECNTQKKVSLLKNYRHQRPGKQQSESSLSQLERTTITLNTEGLPDFRRNLDDITHSYTPVTEEKPIPKSRKKKTPNKVERLPDTEDRNAVMSHSVSSLLGKNITHNAASVAPLGQKNPSLVRENPLQKRVVPSLKSQTPSPQNLAPSVLMPVGAAVDMGSEVTKIMPNIPLGPPSNTMPHPVQAYPTPNPPSDPSYAQQYPGYAMGYGAYPNPAYYGGYGVPPYYPPGTYGSPHRAPAVPHPSHPPHPQPEGYNIPPTHPHPQW